MELHERIRYLRKEHLKMSQTEFGERLGVNRDVIKNMELNLLVRPDQKLPLLKLICSEFGVREEWLLNGDGDMLASTDTLDRLALEYGLSDDMKILLGKIMSLPEDAQDIIGQFIQDTADEFERVAAQKEAEKAAAAPETSPNSPTAADSSATQDLSSATAAAEEAYIKSRYKSVQTSGSSASSTTTGADTTAV